MSMLGNSYLKQINSRFQSQEENNGKNEQRSQNFESQNKQVQKKLSVKTCQSFYNLNPLPKIYYQYKEQRVLFMKYIEKKKSGRQLNSIIDRMKKHWENISVEIKSQIYSKVKVQFSSHFLQFQQSSSVIIHYVLIWLLKMGFKTVSNKNKILTTIQKQVPLQYFPYALNFYQNLGENLINRKERWTLLENVCANGWEFFTFYIIALINKKINAHN